MKCKNCKADNKPESICDAGITRYVLRCGEYGCGLNGKTVDKLLQRKKAATNADRIRAMTDEELAEYICVFFPELCPPGKCPGEDYCHKYWLDWMKQEVDDDKVKDYCYKCWLDWLKQEVGNE